MAGICIKSVQLWIIHDLPCYVEYCVAMVMQSAVITLVLWQIGTRVWSTVLHPSAGFGAIKGLLRIALGQIVWSFFFLMTTCVKSQMFF